jgi:hypothetical protein
MMRADSPGCAAISVTGKARVAPDGAVDVAALQTAVEHIGYRIQPVGTGEKPNAEARAEGMWRRRLLVGVPLAAALAACQPDLDSRGIPGAAGPAPPGH